MNSVFISYSSKDRGFVSKLATDLKSKGINVWYDQWELKVGESLIRKIGDAIKSQDYLIAVLSKVSVQSAWVMKKLSAGLIKELEGRRVVVLPVVIEDCDIPTLLTDKVYADFRRDYLSGLNSLLNALPGRLFPSGISIRDGRELSGNITTANVVNTNVIDTISNTS